MKQDLFLFLVKVFFSGSGRSCFFNTPGKFRCFFLSMFTLPKTNIAPENGWLEDEISDWEGLFSGDMLVSGRVLFSCKQYFLCILYLFFVLRIPCSSSSQIHGSGKKKGPWKTRVCEWSFLISMTVGRATKEYTGGRSPRHPNTS